MKVALDLDGVLADLHAKMVPHTKYSYEDFHTFGEWDDFEHFYSEAARVWKKHWHEIEPVEDSLSHKVAQLAANHEVDIVTNTAAEDRYAKAWLHQQEIVYEDFVRPPEYGYKDALDYDLFIDDNPYLCGDVPVQYVVDQPWNQTERGSGNYLYYSYEESYVESEVCRAERDSTVGNPQVTEGPLKPDPFRSDAPWVIRVNGLDDVLYDLEQQ